MISSTALKSPRERVSAVSEEKFQVITFYEFKDMTALGALADVKARLQELMAGIDIKGTIILADEGFNSTVCGSQESIAAFVSAAGEILGSALNYKSSFYDHVPFRKVDVKIKPEIVTLKKPVDISKGVGTHVKPAEWNTLITDPDVIVLDTRNDYEFRSGTFKRALNPVTEKFSELPEFVDNELGEAKDKKIAMFCTGGIRCEKFAPYLKQIGYSKVYQLEGGILKYLEEVPVEESLWEGECFIFDDRRTLDHSLKKGVGPDLSQKAKPGRVNDEH